MVIVMVAGAVSIDSIAYLLTVEMAFNVLFKSPGVFVALLKVISFLR